MGTNKEEPSSMGLSEENLASEKTKKQGTTARLFDEMLRLIESGKWGVSEAIPSERTLMQEFGVSRIAVREALSMLKALGVLNISHGKSTTVRKMSSETLAKLFPLMLSMEGKQSLTDVFEVRLGLELQTVYLAAQKRTTEDINRLTELAERFDSFDTDTPESIEADHQFHVQIAKSTGNPLFWILLNVLGSYVKFAQRESGKHDPEQHQKASQAHHAILDAIKKRDPGNSQIEMEKHLRDAHHIT